MWNDLITQDAPADDAAWQAIEGLVDEIALLSRSAIAPADFYAGLLDRSVRALAAAAGAVWRLNPQGQLALECQVNLAETHLAESWADQQRHGQLLHQILQSNEARLVAPRLGPTGEGQAANPTDFLLVLSPLVVDAEAHGVLELFQRDATSPAAHQGYLRFVAAVAEIAADYHRGRQLSELRRRESLWGQFEQFAQRIHGKLDLAATAYAIANEGRLLIGCDRLSVVGLRGSKCKLLAMSGVDAVDRRANVVQHVEKLSQAVLSIGDTLWYAGQAQGLPPQIEGPLQTHLDQSHARLLAIMPVRPTQLPDENTEPPLLGALVVEQFHTALGDSAFQQRVAAVCRQSGVALHNAQQYQNLPLLPVMRGLGRIGWLTKARQLPKTILALGAMLIVAAVLSLVPAEFNIEARGELLPQRRRDVFAGVEGVVSEVKVDHAQRVKQGDVLAVLRRPQLELEFTRVSGEIETALKRLSAVQAALLETTNKRTDTPERSGQLTAEEEEIKTQLVSLQQQKEILTKQQAELLVRSPLDGQLLTWDVSQLLQSRPVQRGQVLMTVADVDGPWELEVRIPDERIGHVTAAEQIAKQQGQPQLNVTYSLATEPAVTHEGRLEHLALAAETDKTTGTTVLATVSIDRHDIARLRPGATVIAKIHCGQRSLGYVWFHGLWEAIQSKL